MEDVQYEKQDLVPQAKVPENGGFVAKLIKWGIAKNQKQAEYTLLGVAVVAFIIALWFFRSSSGGLPTNISPDQQSRVDSMLQGSVNNAGR